MKIANETVAPSVEILNSWKEIAGYLNRGVRTVQRWEAELGMPVRRPRGRGRSAVLAVRSELDRWIQACPLEAREKMSQSVTELSVNPAIEQLRTSTLEWSCRGDGRSMVFRDRGWAFVLAGGSVVPCRPPWHVGRVRKSHCLG